MRDLLDLVALATVCDVMPLLGVNRALVSQGLKVMARRARPGIAALLEVAAAKDLPTAMTLGWALGPRINAGRAHRRGRPRAAPAAVRGPGGGPRAWRPGWTQVNGERQDVEAGMMTPPTTPPMRRPRPAARC